MLRLQSETRGRRQRRIPLAVSSSWGAPEPDGAETRDRTGSRAERTIGAEKPPPPPTTIQPPSIHQTRARGPRILKRVSLSGLR